MKSSYALNGGGNPPPSTRSVTATGANLPCDASAANAVTGTATKRCGYTPLIDDQARAWPPLFYGIVQP